MPKPQYNVKLTDTGSKNYNQPAFRPAPAPPKVNPLKNWWNSVVNNARQTNYAPVNTANPSDLNTGNIWDTTLSAFPQFNGLNIPSPLHTDNIWNTTIGATPQYIAGIPTAYGTNTRRGNGARVYPTSPNLFNTINNINRGLNSPFGKPSMQPKPNQNAVQQYSDTGGGSVGPEYMSLNTLVNLGYVDPNASDPYEIGGSPYQQGVWVQNPELPPYYPGGGGGGGGGYGGGGGGSYDYFSRPSSPSYTGYGGNGYASMPQAPNYTGYGGNGYASMPQAPTYRGRGGRNQSIAPATAYYRGINSGGGYGGGYAGGQSQRSAWYGALLQWNI